jgi:hypothetical protein
MRTKPFATEIQRAAWQADCRRKRALKTIKQLTRQLEPHLKPQWANQQVLAEQYRVLLREHRKTTHDQKQQCVVIVDTAGIAQRVMMS